MAGRVTSCAIGASVASILLSLSGPPKVLAQLGTEVATFTVGTPSLPYGWTQFPDVATAPDGTTVFVWAEGQQFDSERIAVTHAYSADGIELTVPTRVDLTGQTLATHIARDFNDGFVAAWEWIDNSYSDYAFGRRLDRFGAGLGPQLLINSDRPTLAACCVVVAGLPSGSVFAWTQENALWARLYDANGAARGPSFSINSGTVGGFDVAVLADGGFVVGWEDWFNGGSWARIYGADGTPRGSSFLVSDEFALQALAASPAGGWAAAGATANYLEPAVADNRVMVRRFHDDGTPAGETVEVFNPGLMSFVQTDVVYDAFGDLYVAWTMVPSDFPYSVLAPQARAFGPDGAALGSAVAISDRPGFDVHAAALPDGNVVNVWEAVYLYPALNQQEILAAVVRACLASEGCVVPPTPTPTASPLPTATASPTPSCGDERLDPGEECDDGNRKSGDGCDALCRIEACGDGRLEGLEQCDPPDPSGRCRADCTLSPAHDSVMVPEKPIDVVIPASAESVTKLVPLQVRNADIEPQPERPGHVIRLLANDGTCPPGTIMGKPDFERGEDGDQDAILVPGGTPRTALVNIFASRQAFPGLDAKIPQRCTVTFTAITEVEGNVDPTPENNVIAVEINVRAAGSSDVERLPGATVATPRFFVRSLKPLKTKLTSGQSVMAKRVKLAIRSARGATAESRLVQLAVDPGTCPPDAVEIRDFGGIAGGTMPVVLDAGGAQSGSLTVTLRAAAFSSANRQSPARCTAMVEVIDVTGMTAEASHRTRLTLEVNDAND